MKIWIAVCLILVSAGAAADTVVPIDSVENWVNVRRSPDTDAEIIGRLQVGIPLPYVASVDGWHEVVVSEGLTGFVSADWSRVVPDEPESGAEADATVSPETVPDEPVPAAAEAVPEEPEPAAPEPPAKEAAAEPEPEPVTEEVAAAEEPEPVPEEMPAEEAVPASEPAATASPGTVAVPQVAAPAGPPGPPGPPGPQGPAGQATIEGDPGYLVRFKEPMIGESSQVFDNGNQVGIGTTTPKQRLEVNGNIQIHEQNSSVAGLMITQSSGETGYIMHNRASTLTLGAGSIDRMTIDRDGNVGIGTARPSHPLEMASGAHVTAGGVWTNSSSRQAKKDISQLTLEEALEALAGLEPVHFKYRIEDGEEYVGFIAEDAPELVATRDRQGLSAMDIAAVLTRVVQEQQRRIDELEARLAAR